MSARYLKFKPADGVAVIARGRLDVYDARGEYQLLVEHLEPRGYGALQLAFEQLKKKLGAEGLFDTARKRPLPRFPQRIGIVTSPAGAVIQDLLNILSRRFPGLHIRLYPAQVQGEGASDQLCRGLRWFSQSGWAEVVILARGGGSLEDLWTFNEESVARAIAESSVPVISAVGHETDFTIADFVSDLRAPTPSAAAELVICTREQLLDSIAGCRRALDQQLRYRLSIAGRRLRERGVDRAVTVLHRSIGRGFQRVDEMERLVAGGVRRVMKLSREDWQAVDSRLRRMDLRLRMAEARRRYNVATERLASSIGEHLRIANTKLTYADSYLRPADLRQRVDAGRKAVDSLKAQLTNLNPLNVLERGYAIVRDQSGHVLKDAAEVAVDGQALDVILARGTLKVRVTEISTATSREPLDN